MFPVPSKRNNAGRKGKAGNAAGRPRTSNKAMQQAALSGGGDGLRIEEEDEAWETEMAAPMQGMIVDGIKYELMPRLKGRTIHAFSILVDGKELRSDPGLPRPVVCKHFGGSADVKWCILAPRGVRLEADNKVELFNKLAKLVNG
jgi:hypothetical protein